MKFLVCYCFVQSCHGDHQHSRLACHASGPAMLRHQAHLRLVSPAQTHPRRPQGDHLSVQSAVMLCLLVARPLLCMTLKEMRLLVTSYSEPARQSSMSALYLPSGCRDASVTGRATFRRLLSRFLDLQFCFYSVSILCIVSDADFLNCDHTVAIVTG